MNNLPLLDLNHLVLKFRLSSKNNRAIYIGLYHIFELNLQDFLYLELRLNEINNYYQYYPNNNIMSDLYTTWIWVKGKKLSNRYRMRFLGESKNVTALFLVSSVGKFIQEINVHSPKDVA